ncbi:type III-A CRISPR-associated protein Cas10/Csm1 [Colibacter massiliensis]|uniref:type III-A CRISPR-associated protein Cas10/Csm1 n=1 Tax=Colibacter massiliensis TaxID=1852379 RepID=UPI00266B713E|nr:type III-A CRISPR-associated protein Cas10/Csm1 [Colibacter massiliensis]
MLDVIVKSALLHDIGKVVYRAGRMPGNHSKAGADFLAQYGNQTVEEKMLLEGVRYHHGKELRQAALDSDSVAYIVYEADNIASSIDRREIEGDTDTTLFDRDMALQSGFTAFGGALTKGTEIAKHQLRGLDPEKKFNYPATGTIQASAAGYQALLCELENNFCRVAPSQMKTHELLRIYEDILSYTPASTNTQEVCDISLFMHSKVTAAIAACIYQYFEEQQITNYKEECFSNNDAFRAKEAFMLIGGDISGIQNFIYNIPSKMALKSLRGRSFYLEMFLENAVDELLKELGLNRCNLLYAGGGHFHILAAATQRTKEAIEHVRTKLNRWLLERTGGLLYVAIGGSMCTGEDLRESSLQRNVFHRVFEALDREKLNRYDTVTLGELFDWNSSLNRPADNSRECAVCRTSSGQLTRQEDGTIICGFCESLQGLGETIVSQKSGAFIVIGEKDSFKVQEQVQQKGIPLFGLQEEKILYYMSEKELDKLRDAQVEFSLYSKNTAVTGKSIEHRIWIADYVMRTESGSVATFEDLAAIGAGEETSQGIRRIGVLRADVDNLGAAFIGGYILSNGTQDPAKYATISRLTNLSQNLNLFFKLAVTRIAQGELPIGIRRFDLLSNPSEPKARHLHIVYAGGDDVFIVGAWKDLIEYAVDLYHSFQRFTQGKLTFSAGISLFPAQYPISRMAEVTGELEAEAKKRPEKNSIALFGGHYDGEAYRYRHVHRWERFIEGVCKDKLNALLEAFYVNGCNENPGNRKLELNTAALHKLLHLVEDVITDRERSEPSMSYARVLYYLARMEDDCKNNDAQRENFNQFSQNLYKWLREEESRNEFFTMLQLIEFLIRDYPGGTILKERDI